DVTAVTEDETGNESDPGSDTAKDVTPPTAPDVKANDDGSVTVTPSDDSTKTTVEYTDEDGNSQTATFTKDPNTGKWVDDNPNDSITVDPDTGVVTIPEDAVKDGTDVTAVTEDETGNESDPGSDTAKDVTPPTAPDVKANDDGSVTVTPSDDSTKTTVEYTDEDGNSQTATFTKDPDTG
ncbi:cell wall anchor protein, partial [[Pasteurella] aerogenes]|nr:cell wall anchor protein [[Pasteurella] aerogenes]